MATAVEGAKGQDRGALGSCDHGGHDAREGAARGGRWQAGVVRVLAVRARQTFDNGDGDGARACFGQCLAARGWRGDG
jgi:hypothetical protein